MLCQRGVVLVLRRARAERCARGCGVVLSLVDVRCISFLVMRALVRRGRSFDAACVGAALRSVRRRGGSFVRWSSVGLGVVNYYCSASGQYRRGLVRMCESAQVAREAPRPPGVCSFVSCLQDCFLEVLSHTRGRARGLSVPRPAVNCNQRSVYRRWYPTGAALLIRSKTLLADGGRPDDAAASHGVRE